MIINASEIRDVPYRDVLTGDELPWKIASWGSPFDKRLLSLTSKRFHTLGELENNNVLLLSEGLELRTGGGGREKLEHHPELAGKQMLDVGPLKKRRYCFRFPDHAIVRVPKEKTYVRKGRFQLPINVSEPPHVLVGASRSFATYHDRFLIVPPRQIGITSRPPNAHLLKALALYLNSDFAMYHQFLMSPQLGVKRDVATLKALRCLPVPFADENNASLTPWVELHQRTQAIPNGDAAFFDDGNEELLQVELSAILKDLNDLTNETLNLDSRQRAAVHDLVHVRLALIDGKVGTAATRAPDTADIDAYARMLQSELDDFLGDDVAARHRVQIHFDQHSGIVEIELVRDTFERQSILIAEANTEAERQFQKARSHLLQQRSQWVYFNRNLRIYEGSKTYLFKPFRRLHWNESQAIVDAGEIIAETLQPNDARLERVAG